MVSTEAGHHWMIIAAVFVGLISAVSSQDVDQCASNPCVRGECEDFFNLFFVCFCGDTGYTGSRCETPITPCGSNPCQNGGTCEIYLDVAYVCQCPSTYQGDICTEVITDPTPEATTDPTSEATTPTSLTTLFSGAADDICGTVPSRRIVGGTDAALGRYPWQGRLVSEEYTCGLSLINNEWAVTAAHCVTKEIEVTVIGAAFGYVNADDLSSFQETPIDRIYLHPGYNDLTFENDIALLHLDPPVNYTTNVRPICLETSDTEQELYDTCFTSGYGLLQINGGFPETLQEVELDLLEKGECVELNVTDNQICAGASQKGICPGDSGGPLACQRSDGRFSLVGITSFLVPVNNSCGESSSAFTRVSQYNDFIGNVIRNRDTTPNCEPIASQMCADVLPYPDTYVTSQEDFFEPLASLVANTTDECRPRVIRFWCAHTFQECSEDPGTERVQLCLQECINFAEECARSPEEVAQFSSLCLPLPLAEDPNQEYCPYGPDPVCSGHLNLTGDPTLLTSPNYPDVYFPLAQCQWTISAPEGYQILLKRVTFDTEENYDNVVIGTGLDPEDRPSALNRFSGQLAPESSILDTNEMWIVFAPLNGFQRSGFEYELIAVQNESECSNNTFQCPGENYCIPQRWTCDSVADCQDGADEAGEMCSTDDICGTVLSGRIVGGTDAVLGRYPWQGLLVSGQYTCGLSLIDNEWAVTAAHCVTKEIEVTVIGASFGFVNADDLSSIQATAIDRMYLHPGYNDLTFENDIALLHLDPPVNYTTNVRPICLETSDTEPELYDTCIASGFGVLQLNGESPENLQEVELDLLEKGECVELNVTDNQICAGAFGKGACPGDSGGPLACQRSDGRFSLVGVTSFFALVNDSCGESSSAFARVSQYNDFIGNVITNRDTTPNCEPIASQICADVLPYSDTFGTSQEDLFESLGLFIANTTDECQPMATRFWCAHIYQDCSEDPSTPRVQFCRQACLDFAEECAGSPEGVEQFGSLCLRLPVAEDPNQEYCPYGPDPVCSGHLNLTRDPTVLTSPNFPDDDYFSLTDCQWTISAPEGYQIFVKQGFFDTEPNFDNVIIGIGLDPEDRPSALGSFSGRLDPQSRVLDTNEMWIVFAPDASLQSFGFEYELIAVRNESECSNDTFQCPGENYCIPYTWTCDNVADCQDGADEAGEMCPDLCVTPSNSTGFCVEQLPYSSFSYQMSTIAGSFLEAEDLYLNLEAFGLFDGCEDPSRLFICGVLHPECPEEATGYFPCREACEDLVESCPSLVEVGGLNCSSYAYGGIPTGNGLCLPEQDLCVTPSNSTGFCVEQLPYSNFSYQMSTIAGSFLEAEDLYLNLEAFGLFDGCEDPSRLFICGVLHPECPEEATGYFPCREACEDLVESCPILVEVGGLNCSSYAYGGIPTGNGLCLPGLPPNGTTEPPDFTTMMPELSTVTSEPVICEDPNPDVTGFCIDSLPYSSFLIDPAGVTNVAGALTAFDFLDNVGTFEGCPDSARLLVCGILLPECPTEGAGYFLCREACERAIEGCLSLTSTVGISCADFPPGGILLESGVCMSELPVTTEPPTVTETSAPIPVTGDCVDYLGYEYTRPLSLYNASLDLPREEIPEELSSLCPNVSAALCFVLFPPQLPAEQVFCYENCAALVADCPVLQFIFDGFTAESCESFSLRADLPSGYYCFGDEPVTESPTTSSLTTSFPDDMTTLFDISTETELPSTDVPETTTPVTETSAPIPITGVCVDHLDYDYTRPLSLYNSSSGIPRELIPESVSNVCPDVSAALCFVVFPPQLPAEQVFCYENCAALIAECQILEFILDGFTAESCESFSLRADLPSGYYCFGDEPVTEAPTTAGLTTFVRDDMTTIIDDTTEAAVTCEEANMDATDFCIQGLPYSIFFFPSEGITNIFEAMVAFDFLSAFGTEGCPDSARLFLCGVLLSECPTEGAGYFSCREACEAVFEGCPSLATIGINCTDYVSGGSGIPLESGVCLAELPETVEPGTEPPVTEVPAPIPITGVCVGYLDYDYTRPLSLYNTTLSIPREEIPETVSSVCSGVSAALCFVVFPPQLPAEQVFCYENCAALVGECSIVEFIFDEFTAESCESFSLRDDLNSGYYCFGDEPASEAPTTVGPTTPFTDDMTTLVDISTETAPIPITGVCIEYLDYEYTRPLSLYNTTLGIPREQIPETVSSLCPDVSAALCFVVFPPQLPAEQVFCYENCAALLADCPVFQFIFDGFTAESCESFSLRADLPSGYYCFDDEPVTESPTTTGLTTFITDDMTTLVDISTETAPIPIIGVCIEYLDYEYTRPLSLYNTTLGIPREQIPETVSSLCPDVSAALCFVVFPPQLPAEQVFCYENCAALLADCPVFQFIFDGFTAESCESFSLRADLPSGYLCFGDEPVTESPTTTGLTTFITDDMTTLVDISTETAPIPITGVCIEYLDYEYTRPLSLYNTTLGIPREQIPETVSSLCPDVSAALCFVVFPPQLPAEQVFCYENCAALLADCPVFQFIFDGFTAESCESFSLLADLPSGYYCFGDGPITESSTTSGPTTFITEDMTTLVDISTETAPIPIPGVCVDNLDYDYTRPLSLYNSSSGIPRELIPETVSSVCPDVSAALCFVVFPPQLPAEQVFCYENCALLFVECQLLEFIFDGFTAESCESFSFRANLPSGYYCFGDEPVTDAPTTAVLTTFFTDDMTTLFEGSTEPAPIPITGVCVDYLDYDYTRPLSLYNTSLDLPRELIPETVSSVCPDVSAAICFVVFPPPLPAEQVFCYENCAALAADCQVLQFILDGFTAESCESFPLRDDLPSGYYCFGDPPVTDPPVTVTPASNPIMGICREFLPYRDAQLQSLYDLSLIPDPSAVADSVNQNELCPDGLASVCFILFPPAALFDQIFCYENCTSLVSACPALAIFLDEFTEDSCSIFPVDGEVPDGYCFGDEAAAVVSTTESLTTSLPDDPTTFVEDSTEADTTLAPNPITGICSNYLPYQNANLEPLYPLELIPTSDALADRLNGLELCPDQFAAICLVLFPPQSLAEGFGFCYETCMTLEAECPILPVFLGGFDEESCQNFPLRAEVPPGYCFADIPPSTLPPSTTEPPPSEPVTGVCSDILPYDSARPEPLAELVIEMPDLLTAAIFNNNFCRLAEEVCSLFFPPLRSSGLYLCRDSCVALIEDCSDILAFFMGLDADDCSSLPLREDVGDEACLPGRVSTTETTTIDPRRCFRPCTQEYAPICGSDGVTYGNLCEFEVAQCLDPSLTYTEGECDSMTTEFGSTDETTVLLTTEIFTTTVDTETPLSSTVPPGAIPVLGLCSGYLDYQYAQSEPAFDLTLNLPLETATASVLLSDQCSESAHPAACAIFYPPLQSSNYAYCLETCVDAFMNCPIFGIFFRLATLQDCLTLPLRVDVEGNDEGICIAALSVSTTTTAEVPTTTEDDDLTSTGLPITATITATLLTTEAETTVPPGSIPVIGVCSNYLDYRYAQPDPLFPLALDLPLDALTAAVQRSDQCSEESLPAACALFYPPLPSSGYTLCRETCRYLAEACPILAVFVAAIGDQECSEFPLQSEVEGVSCIGAVPVLSSTEELTSTEVTTTAFVSTVPPGSIPVVGVCSDYLDYRYAQSDPLFPLALALPLNALTDAVQQSGQCSEEILPAACALFYPPLPSSGYTLCRETCGYLTEACPPLRLFFAVIGEQECSEFPLQSELEEGQSCLGAVPVISPTPSVLTTELTTGILDGTTTIFMTTETETSTPSPTPTVPSIPVPGPCSEFLSYPLACDTPVFDYTVGNPLEEAARLLVTSGLCQAQARPAACALLYPPLPSSGYAFCQEVCSEVLEGCPLVTVFFSGFNAESCGDLPTRDELGGDFCIGDLTTTPVVTTPSTTTTIIGDLTCQFIGCLNGGTCAGNDLGEFFFCLCPLGFTGPFCAEPLTLDCNVTPCQNGGLCLFSGGNNICFCPTDYTGTFCERERVISSTPPTTTTEGPTSPKSTTLPTTTEDPCPPGSLPAVTGVCASRLPYDETYPVLPFPLVNPGLYPPERATMITLVSNTCFGPLLTPTCSLFYPPCPSSGLYICPETCRLIFSVPNGCEIVGAFLDFTVEDCDVFPEGQDQGNGLCLPRQPTTTPPTTEPPTPTTTIEVTTTTEPPPTTTEQSTSTEPETTPTLGPVCYPVPEFCQATLAYDETSSPPTDGLELIYRRLELVFDCHPSMALYACALVYPPCEPAGARTLCQTECLEVEDSCADTNLIGRLLFMCEIFMDLSQDGDGLCLAALPESTTPGPTIPPTTTPSGPPCLSNPCQNGGLCIDNINIYICLCNEGFDGVNCEIDSRGACSLEPCQNGGTCLTGEGDSYSCQCVEGFFGVDCEAELVPVHEDCTRFLSYANGIRIVEAGGVDSFLNLHFVFVASCHVDYARFVCTQVYLPGPESPADGYCASQCSEIRAACQDELNQLPNVPFPGDCSTLPNNPLGELTTDYGLCRF